MSRTRARAERPADPKPTLNLQALAKRVGEAGSVWVKRGLEFDFPIEVESIAVVLGGPDGARSVVV